MSTEVGDKCSSTPTRNAVSRGGQRRGMPKPAVLERMPARRSTATRGGRAYRQERDEGPRQGRRTLQRMRRVNNAHRDRASPRDK